MKKKNDLKTVGGLNKSKISVTMEFKPSRKVLRYYASHPFPGGGIGDVCGNRRRVAKAWNCNVWQSLDHGGDDFMIEIGKDSPYKFNLDSFGIVDFIAVLVSALRAAGVHASDPDKVVLDISGNGNHLRSDRKMTEKGNCKES